MSKIISSFIIATLLYVGTLTPVLALQDNDASAYSAALEELTQSYHEVYGFAGTIKVLKGGEPLIERSYGLANREFQIANEPSFPISINSISKTFTAVAIMQLMEQGKIKLHAPISDYLPDLQSDWKDKITTHHLLTHSSGLPRESGIQRYRNLSFQQQVSQFISQQELLFEPGQRYEYSNSGITLLGLIIEEVTQQKYADVIQRQIIEPLGLKNTGVYEGNKIVNRQVSPYRMAPNGVVGAQRTKHLGDNAGGGMYSTVGDLYQYMMALEQNQLLASETTAQMFEPRVKMSGDDAAAYGWTLKPFAEHTLLFASGSGFGSKGILVRSPSQNDFIAITANWGNTPILQLMAAAFLLINDIEYELADRNILPKVSDYLAYLGTYTFESGVLQQHLMMDSDSVTLQQVDGKLFLNDELLAKQEGKRLGLTYTNEVSIEFMNNKVAIEINGNRLVGSRQ